MNIPFIEYGVIITGVTYKQLGLAVDTAQEYGGPGGWSWETKNRYKKKHFVTFECFYQEEFHEPPKSKGRLGKFTRYLKAKIAKLPKEKRVIFKNLQLTWGMVKVMR